jgi:hypothetical protein
LHLAAVETRLDEWPLASEPVGDEYTPARPDDVWFEDGCVNTKPDTESLI